MNLPSFFPASIRAFFLALVLGFGWEAPSPAAPLTVPYTELFATGAANWKTGNNLDPLWVQSGGPSGTNSISQVFTVQGGSFSGPTLFRGEASYGFSNDRFVGDWITAGVTDFSVALWHSAPVPVKFEVRFASVTSNSPGASTFSYSVPSSTWTTITLPIEDSATVFQAYSQYPPPNEEVFDGIFSDLGRIQITLAALSQQDPSLSGNSYTFALAAPSIVPEPGTWAMLAGVAAVAAAAQWRRLRGRHAA